MQAFRESHRLLVAFGISAVPATLLLFVMGVDFLEGDFGPAGAAVMVLAGGVSLLCAAMSVKARRLWREGAPLGVVQAAMFWPIVLVLGALWMSLLAYTTEFSFLLGKP